jgi:hypothetical protein
MSSRISMAADHAVFDPVDMGNHAVRHDAVVEIPQDLMHVHHRAPSGSVEKPTGSTVGSIAAHCRVQKSRT